MYRISSMEIEFYVGTGITSACMEAVFLAEEQDAVVQFVFNGVEMEVTPESEVVELLEIYRAAINPEEV